MTRLAVVGGGAWGTVLAHILASQGHGVDWWVYEPDIEESVVSRRMNDRYFPGFQIDAGVKVIRELRYGDMGITWLTKQTSA